jgi:hypothetical protein
LADAVGEDGPDAVSDAGAGVTDIDACGDLDEPAGEVSA